MKSILEKIVDYKKLEVENCKKRTSIKNIEKKEAVLEINSRIKEVNISFVYLLIIYLIIILLIKYIK